MVEITPRLEENSQNNQEAPQKSNSNFVSYMNSSTNQSIKVNVKKEQDMEINFDFQEDILQRAFKHYSEFKDLKDVIYDCKKYFDVSSIIIISKKIELLENLLLN